MNMILETAMYTARICEYESHAKVWWKNSNIPPLPIKDKIM